MDANELATIAFDAMPLDVLAEADKGQVWGVLQMALRTLEAQHESLLTEADNEAAATMRTLGETQNELVERAEELRSEQKALAIAMKANIALGAERDTFAAELDAVGKRLANARRELNVVKDQRDALENERRLFLRGEGSPGALSLAQRDRENAVLEMKAAQRAADEFKLQRSVAESELSTCRADRDMFKRLRAQCMNERDAYATKLEEVQAELQKRIDGLNAENARLHRSLEERMSVQIPGLLQLEKLEDLGKVEKLHNLSAQIPGAVKEELHGMADVYAQSQRMQAEEAPPINVYPPGTKVARGKT